MPYIKPALREWLKTQPPGHAVDSGQLNYQITQVCLKYLRDKTLNYNTINEIVGALECCKHELYRRVAAGYEDIKCECNGDVYHLTSEQILANKYCGGGTCRNG
jgi:hypothetical protein